MTQPTFTIQSAIALDAGMSVTAALRRLARHGYWLRVSDAEASKWIQEVASRTKRTPEAVAARLTRDPGESAVAIREQRFANILWHSRYVDEVLDRCSAASPEATLLDALGLNQSDGSPTVTLEDAPSAPADTVILDGDQPIGISQGAADFSHGVAVVPGPTLAPPVGPPVGESSVVRGWPRLDAPSYMPAETSFEVVVGLAAETQKGVAGGQIVLNVPEGTRTIPLEVVLIADGVDAPQGWSQPLNIDVSNPTEAVARFTLVGRPPSAPDPVHLTTLEARYMRDGAIVGTASRPLVIGQPSVPVLDNPAGQGSSWLSRAETTTPLALDQPSPPDLTIELVKPGDNAANGVFTCWLRSPHQLSVSSGPYNINLGEDAETFAKGIVDGMRESAGEPIIDNVLQGFGGLIADQLPAEAMTAIVDVAKIAAPAPPSVLIISADQYVPWELAQMPQPLDLTRPPYLGAQVLLGRWLQDRSPRSLPDGYTRPPVNPPDTMTVRHMAVMTGQYRMDSGLQSLPEAEKEAQSITTTYNAVPLPASRPALKSLLDAALEHESVRIGGADAVHFAGHGEFDPARADSSVLLLNDGRPLGSIVFRSAKYGGQQQPLFFLNACMIGIGGQMLGDMGGFPGNCLKGGFGGLLGALWEVDDVAASEVALEFWNRALPASGPGEPVGAILRDLRGKYQAASPESTYLSYVYYGHPGLTLRRS